jgi:hypothetical protein
MSYGSHGPNKDTKFLTDALWTGFAREKIFAGLDRDGVGMIDDFVGFGGILSTTAGQYFSSSNRYRSYQTASTLLTNVALTTTPATVAPTSIGAINLAPTSGVADNDTITMFWGGHELTPYGSFPFSVIPKMSGPLVFECRIKVASIAVDIGNFFIGLAGAAGVDPATAVVPFTASDDLVDTLSLLGFGRRAGATDGATGLYYARAGGTHTLISSVATLVADTYIKLGFKWDPLSKTVMPWVDGVPVPTKVVSSTVTAATPWPNDYMTPIMSTMQKDGTTAQTLTVDWWACAQQFNAVL